MFEREGLKGKAQIDFLKILAALVRKYGTDNEMRLSPEDLRSGGRGGIKRTHDFETGEIVFRYEKSGEEGTGSKEG